MDDQASKLRQLVRSVRHAATAHTGPPLLLVYSTHDDAISQQLYTTLGQRLASRGASVSHAGEGTALPPTDCRLVRRAGPFALEDLALWQQASVMITVLHGDDESIVEGYTQLKRAFDHSPLPPQEFAIVGDNTEAAHSAADRLTLTCERFLHCRVAGVTLLDEARGPSIDPLVDRLLALAAVAPKANSPLAFAVE